MKKQIVTASSETGRTRGSISMLSRRAITAVVLGASLMLGAAGAALAGPSGYEPHGPHGRGQSDSIPDSASTQGGGTTAGASSFGYYSGGEPAPKPGYAGAMFFNGWQEEDRFNSGPQRARGCYTSCLAKHTEKYCQKHYQDICEPEAHWRAKQKD